MKLHTAKRVALLQLCNWVSATDLTYIEDLFDGEFFLNIIHTIFGFQYVAALSEKDSEELKGKVNSEKEKDKVNGEEEEDEVTSEEEKDKVNSEEELKAPSELEDAEPANTILEKFKFIQKFINDKYFTDSLKVISYADCAEGNEFELAKVASFILSEVVRHFVITNNDHFKTLSLLEVKVQEDLEECFNLFISDRNNISKSKVEKVLGSHAKYKAHSPSKSSFITPRRSCSSKYRMTSPSFEDIFTSSPLKTFFESPVFKTEDIKLKEKEISKTREKLHEVEIKCDELQFELKEAKKQLKEKDNEMKALKAIRTRQGLDEMKNEDELMDENNRLKKEIEQIQKEYELELSEYKKEVSFLQNYMSHKTRSYRERGEPLEELLMHKDHLLVKLQTRNEKLHSDVDSLEAVIKKMDKQLTETHEQLEEMQFDLLKNQSLYLEKLSEFKETLVNEDSEFPATEENVGKIYEEENRILHSRIKQLEEQLEQYNKMVQPEEVPDTRNDFGVSMPVLLSDTETPEEQKLAVLKKHSKKDEFSGLADECDFSSNSEVASKHSVASSHSEVKCLQESPFTENTPEPVLETYGTLWKNLENCQLGSEHSDTLENLNGYSQGNLLNKSCCHCDKIHLECESMKMTREHAIQLEKKEEEIEKLKAFFETMQQEQDESKSTIEDLQTKLDEKTAKCKTLQGKLLFFRESFLSERAKMKDYDEMVERITLMEYEKKRWEKEHKVEVQQLRISNEKMGKEKYSCLIEYKNLTKLYNTLEIQISKLKSQKSQLQKQLNAEMEISFKKSKELEYLNACLERERKQDRVQRMPKSESFFVEMNESSSKGICNESSSKDICNESMLSGALCRKNGFQFISHDEADFLNQSSLEDIKKDYRLDRMRELLRRNSTVPGHLKSSYPTEMNLSLSTDKFYVTQRVDSPINENPGETVQHKAPVKKRKRELDHDIQKELAQTPLAKQKKPMLTPKTLRKLIYRNRCKGHVKPKPSFYS